MKREILSPRDPATANTRQRSNIPPYDNYFPTNSARVVHTGVGVFFFLGHTCNTIALSKFPFPHQSATLLTSQDLTGHSIFFNANHRNILYSNTLVYLLMS